MQLTLLTGEYPPMQGGIADYTAHLLDHLAPCGIAATVLTSRRWQTAQAASSSPSAHAITASIPAWGWRCWPHIWAYLKTHQPDLLHIQYQAAMYDLGGWVNGLPWYLKRRGCPVKIITTFHDLRIPYLFPKAGRLRWWSVLGLARFSDGVICTNREDLQTLGRHIRHLGQSTVIPLGNNIEPQLPPDYDRQSWRQRYQAEADTLLLAYFGFLNASKGGEALVESVALLRQRGINARLLLIGGEVGDADGSNQRQAEQIQALIAAHGLAEFVHRTGYVGQQAVSANLMAADAVVLPYRDGVSFRRTTLIAALRHGCPIVSTLPTDLSLIPEIRANQTMLLARPDEAESLAETISRLVDNPTLRAKLSDGARHLGDLFEWPHIAQKTATFYQQILAKTGPQSP